MTAVLRALGMAAFALAIIQSAARETNASNRDQWTTMTISEYRLESKMGHWPMIERAFRLPNGIQNVWAADVWAIITLPDGHEANIPAFFDGDKTWKIRFTPTSRGRHSFHRLVVNGMKMDHPSQLSSDGLPLQFDIQGPPIGAGFLRPSPRRTQQFVFDDATPYYPFGQNCGWLAWDDYDARFAKMKAAGLNWTRVWMCHWAHQNLDWRINQPMEPGSLDLEVARAWDGIIAAAERHGISLQLVLQHHGQYSTFVNPNWHENPWNAANGGWLEKPQDFFTDAKACELTRRKYRYIVARWGYSPAIMAWELFNEVQFTDAYVAPDMLDLWNTWLTNGKKVTPELLKKAADILVRLNNSPAKADAAGNLSLLDLQKILSDLEYGWIPYAAIGSDEDSIAAWHDEMADAIRAADPWRHMVTTSSIPAFSPIWAKMDFYQYHTYRPDMIEAVRQFDKPASEFDRPVFYGEIGHHSIPDPAREDGRYMRTMLWASLFAGGAGPAQMWDWIKTDQIDFYDEFAALAKFIAAADFARLEYNPASGELAATNAATSAPLRLLGAMSSNRTILWIFDPETIHADSPPEITAKLSFAPGEPRTSRILWHDTRTGRVIKAESTAASAPSHHSPPFRGDIAVILETASLSSFDTSDNQFIAINAIGAMNHESDTSH